ncbi:MAG: alpha/beta hydrolase [Pseudomonadales bacterium]|jgi:acetyl esterase/lipase|nr:alpha/beta hydrolase [Pseudomonadales bacterium]MDP7359224.1 alpha/beta hydrolase [Pseudomonadales bacterium]MDP7595181.1 alpha/beta hydrolase [Pseudomonadales bacterium]HJN50176.1 alpha/beta hydrolase [Pseudomonadales bacterium]|tara:strand:+ start:1868 stop:2746 length:879 start_codon:yes stop_codon:yes gene_type:complete
MVYEVSEEELVYGSAGELELMGQWYRPKVPDGASIPVIIEVHGGAWYSGDRFSGRYYNQALAAAGCGVLAIDFRHGPDYQHPAATADIAASVRFVKRNSGRLGVDPSGIALAGSSSGGHLALLVGLNGDVAQHRTTRVMIGDSLASDEETSAAVDCVVALWPVTNPLARYQYAHSFKSSTPRDRGNWIPERLAGGHDAYFGSQQTMHAASIQRMVFEGDFQRLPPVLLVQPELDQNVPVFMSRTLAGAYELAGGSLQLSLYQAVGHGFAHRPGPATDACVAEMLEFIRDHVA